VLTCPICTAIALPSQLGSAEIKTAPTSRRNLTLPDLLVQCRHYSTPTKREALQEILKLLEDHPFLLQQHLLPLTTTISHLIPADSRSVRAAARDVLKVMAEGLSKGQLVSISSGLVLFTISALSNLEDVVRIDALKVLDLLLAYIPEEICRGWDGSAEVSSGGGEDLLMGQAGKEGEDKGTGAKVVEALLGMLKIRSAGLQKAQGAFTTQAAGSDLSPSVRFLPSLLSQQR
jgi:pre-rRNA-processing protein IPI1